MWSLETRDEKQHPSCYFVIYLCPASVPSAASPYLYRTPGQGSRRAPTSMALAFYYFTSFPLLPFSFLVLFPLAGTSPEVQRLMWFVILDYVFPYHLFLLYCWPKLGPPAIFPLPQLLPSSFPSSNQLQISSLAMSACFFSPFTLIPTVMNISK